MSDGDTGRKDAPAPKRERKPRGKEITLLRGYCDMAGIAHKPGERVKVTEAEAKRLVEEQGAARYG